MASNLNNGSLSRRCWGNPIIQVKLAFFSTICAVFVRKSNVELETQWNMHKQEFIAINIS